MIAPGTVLQNRYAVERQIGAGGMGAVYVATDRRFGSTVALKETFFDDPGLRRAFEREARLLNRLRHPALPRVSDHFEESEGQFLVMEYIPGEDLSQMLKARGGAGFPAPQASTQPTPAPSPVEQQAAEATPTPQATPAAQRRAASAPAPRSTPPEPEQPGVHAPHPPHPGVPALPPEAAADPALRGRDLRTQPLTHEEMRALLRRAAQERRRARLERERILEEQRRQRRLEEQQRRRGGSAYPPAPPPPQ